MCESVSNNVAADELFGGGWLKGERGWWGVSGWNAELERQQVEAQTIFANYLQTVELLTLIFAWHTVIVVCLVIAAPRGHGLRVMGAIYGLRLHLAICQQLIASLRWLDKAPGSSDLMRTLHRMHCLSVYRPRAPSTNLCIHEYIACRHIFDFLAKLNAKCEIKSLCPLWNFFAKRRQTEWRTEWSTPRSEMGIGDPASSE